MPASPVHATVEYDRPGKRHGQLRIPFSYNMAGWANVFVPITVIQGGPGPTALVMAGNHGDEYPGQVAVLKLLRELDPKQVTGRLILIPALNSPAAKASTRLSPIDGKNLNRCFPGDPAGSVTDIIADYLTTVLFPMSDIVIDIHTGGRGVDFVPCAHMHLVPAGPQRDAMLSGTEAWLSDYCFLYADIAGTGLLPVEAERQGKTVITTEMGGTENVTAEVHAMTQRGLRNVLRHFGLLDERVLTRAEVGLGAPRWVESLDRSDYMMAPESGLFEKLVPLGAPVRAGEPLGLIHFLERPDREPVAVIPERDGLLIAVRGPSLVSQGDCVACIGHEVNPRARP